MTSAHPSPHQHGQHEHAHHEHEHDLLDWDQRGETLEREAELDLGWIEQALDWVAAGSGSSGHPVELAVDLGSGPGVAAAAIATAFPVVRVTAVDGSQALLDRAIARAQRLGLGDRVDTLQQDLSADLSQLPPSDLLWISKVLHHLPDPGATLTALRHRVRPGGRIGIVEGGLPVRWAPEDLGIGRPGLQARLDVAVGEALLAQPEPHGIRPGTDWAGLLRAAGFTEVATRSWLDEVPAPAPEAVRVRVRERLTLTHDRLGALLDPHDRSVVERLLDPAEPLGIDRRPDLFWLTAQTVHTGRA